MSERHKYLKVQKDEEYSLDQVGGSVSANAVLNNHNRQGRQMQQNNQYYFNGGKKDDSKDGEDDFWYQTPKGVANQSGFGNGGYP